MKLAQFACAFGRHSLDRGNISHLHGSHFGKCRRCAAPMEEVTPDVWEVQQVRDAGLGRRYLR